MSNRNQHSNNFHIFEEYKPPIFSPITLSMSMAVTFNSRPRFKERHSRSFRSLQLLKGEQDIGNHEKQLGSIKDLVGNMQDKSTGLFHESLVTQQKEHVLQRQSSAAKREPPSYFENNLLEPIDELSHEKLDIIAESLREKGPLTEADVQELLLSFTYTSSMIDNILKKNSINKGSLPNSSLSSLRETLKSRWVSFLMCVMNKFDTVQSKLFECLWRLVLYFSFCFPKWAKMIRYEFLATSLPEKRYTNYSNEYRDHSM